MSKATKRKARKVFKRKPKGRKPTTAQLRLMRKMGLQSGMGES
jgi:hypothetical protein